MATKICLRSGQCCHGLIALVPKHEHSDLSPANIDNMEDFDSYIEEHSEGMGNPCKWLSVDEETAEATCLAHTRKSSMCIDYPEDIGLGSQYCGIGLKFWTNRKQSGKAIPEWVDVILNSLNKS